MSAQRRHVAIVHPDLGIGGAEQLILNLGLALKDRGYTVTIYTPHFDPNHCFQEARELDVVVKGSWFPRSIFGRMIALCAYIRMFLCCLYLVLLGRTFYCYVLDQVSFPIPLLRLRNRNVLFYCHFPDKLLSTNDRTSRLKRAYRLVLDYAEEVTTGMARSIVVNSNFTLKIFQDAFPILHRRQVRPQVLYPCIQEKSFRKTTGFQSLTLDQVLARNCEGKALVLSLNRYERKKNINLAIEAFAHFKGVSEDRSTLLVVAGGYDPRLPENVEHYNELLELAQEMKVERDVVFLRSISNDERLLLLEKATVLLYTPENEHFGIVPVEAMYKGCVVVACNSGGPLESIEHEKTGFLLSPNAIDWGLKIHKIFQMPQKQRQAIIDASKARVEKMFTFKQFATHLDEILTQMVQ